MNQTWNEVKRQSLRGFTVRIRDPGTEETYGTGIVVSTDGMVVTCAHVFEDIVGIHPREATDEEVEVYFPQARTESEKIRRAKVRPCLDVYDDDIVLLQLTDGPVPLDPEQIAVLGPASESEGNPFVSYGFRPLGNTPGGGAMGDIVMIVDPPEDETWLTEPVQLDSKHLDHGMSGSAVLDKDRNLVVGIVYKGWESGKSFHDRDTAWAVDAVVLSRPPFNLQLRDQPLPLNAPSLHLDFQAAQAAAGRDLGVDLDRPFSLRHPALLMDIEMARTAAGRGLGLELVNAPPPLAEWVGRDDLINQITIDWLDDKTRVTGLIGFGGEGKSSLARRWLDDLLADESKPQPDGVFWWGFYDRPSVDEFFEAALNFLGQGQIDPAAYPSANAKAHFIAGMLHAGRYLFVLDGLEVMQHQEGDDYGLLRSNDLREFLEYFAAPSHRSFCLITSRAPVLDLMDYTTYVHREVMRLSARDGRDLLRKLGVLGTDQELDQVVADWDGHALTLSLVGSHVAERHGGDVAYARDAEPFDPAESRYERVHRVLRRYDDHMTEAERAFLKLFSVFRKPVREEAFAKVFRTETEATDLNAPVAALSEADFQAMIERLLKYRILRHDERESHYTAHPLIRRHYEALLCTGDQEQTQAAHQRIKDYYLDLAGDVPTNPTLDDLAPLIEVVHHACGAGAYDEAHEIHRSRIDQKRHILSHQLGAYETQLALMQEFFSDSDPYQEARVTPAKYKSWILNQVGLCLMNLGRLGQAAPFFERASQINEKSKRWHNASINYQNLAELQDHLGDLAASTTTAKQALDLARLAKHKLNECRSLAWQAWAAHLQSDVMGASEIFIEAEALEREIDRTQKYLYGLRGIQHADHLRRVGKKDYARCVIEANLKTCGEEPWLADLIRCHRVLGDLDANDGRHDTAREHYDEALRIVRGITHRPTLIEALLARGRWYAKHMKDSAAAFSDLREALGYATRDGYRLYEADIRNALAWAHLASSDLEAAKTEAERARAMSQDMGYYWGQVDADEVLGEIEKQR